MNLLVVDADESFREQIVSALKSMEHETYVASNGEDALEVFFEDNIDIVITALELGDSTGLEFLETARGASPGSRIILTGDNLSRADQLAAYALGAVAVLKKPVANEALQMAVTKAGVSLGNKPGTVYEKIGLADILQSFLRLRANKTVELVDVGSVHVVEGKVVHAVAGTSVGIEALRRLLSTPSPQLRTSNGDPKSPRTIHGSLDYLLKTLGPPTAPAIYPAPAPDVTPEVEQSEPTPDIQAFNEAALSDAKTDASAEAGPDLSDSYISELADSMDIRAEALPKSRAAPILLAAAVVLAVAIGAWAMSGDKPKPGKYELVGAPEVKVTPPEPVSQEEATLPPAQLKLLAGEGETEDPE